MASSSTQARRKTSSARHNLVLADPVALIYLQEDPTVEVVSRRETLTGYDCFLVEQWACSRSDPTFIIATFTGDEKSKINVGVLSVPSDEEAWSMNLKLYFEGLVKYATKKQDTPLGTIMVTNLSSFPSALTVISIPNGDVIGNRESFFVNENLKRLGCSGRVGLTLSTPSAATAAKFYQLYRASDKIPFNAAVLELVKLCQTALVLFGELYPDYADGLLCDMTEDAIASWWVEFGAEYYSIEPHDGVLGPTTVAALLGTLIGARNRLQAYGAPIGKDVFDVDNTRRAIAHFQKSHRMPRSGRLDRQTLARIHRSTAKAASGEGWSVPRAVKSTMAELGGKGGEMVMDMVGAGSKSRISEVETVDIEQFMQNVQGECAKWLWRGKPRKETLSSALSPSSTAPAFPLESGIREAAGLRRTPTSDALAELADDKERAKKSRASLERGTTARQLDGSRKLGRLKDAVGLSSGSRSYKDVHGRPDGDTTHTVAATKAAEVLPNSSPSSSTRTPSAVSPAMIAQISTADNVVRKSQSVLSDWSEEDFKLSQGTENKNYSDQVRVIDSVPPGLSSPSNKSETPSVAGSICQGPDFLELFDGRGINVGKLGPAFKRTQSFTDRYTVDTRPNLAKWPRHLSFSLAADSVLLWNKLDGADDIITDGLLEYQIDVIRSQKARVRLQSIDTDMLTWVDCGLGEVERSRVALGEDQRQLESAFADKAEEHRDLSIGAKEVMESERAQLEESAKETEVLGAKLEYEINVLRGKVEDVEDGVAEFERQVNQVEERVSQLESSTRPKEGWWWSRLSWASSTKKDQ